MWISPDITGERPPPCAYFTLTSIDKRRAVLFGGRIGIKDKMNDVYIIDLLTMVCQLLYYGNRVYEGLLATYMYIYEDAV